MKKSLRMPLVVWCKDEKGKPFVRVEVCGAVEYSEDVNPWATHYAMVDAEDYEAYIMRGYSPNWHMNASSRARPFHAYVRVRLRGVGKRQVAHLIVQPLKGCCISYKDNNPLNLRRSNLVIGQGRSKGDCRYFDDWLDLSTEEQEILAASAQRRKMKQ